MAIPVYLQQFKAAGIYRLVFDKSTVQNVNSEILRLVVGYSEKGPFNIPTYVKSVADFKAIYGDISKKLEKRGVYFHRLALQCLEAGPILALNLKKFGDETIGAATINTTFDAVSAIAEKTINVTDIYDRTRFWEISAENLNNLERKGLDQYINMSAIGTKENSSSFFIRKATGSDVAGFNVSFNDWYKDEGGVPENLTAYADNLIADTFAEVYVFGGKFTPEQVLASSSLKNYFTIEGNTVKLKPYVINANGDVIDTLAALAADENSNLLGHYVGSLIPKFKNKLGQYAALDIAFNLDEEVHNMMMAFNDNMLDEGEVNIDLTGFTAELNFEKLFAGNEQHSVLGNKDAFVGVDKITYGNNVFVKNADGSYSTKYAWSDEQPNRIEGALYVNEIHAEANNDGSGSCEGGHYVVLKDLDGVHTAHIHAENATKLVELAKTLGVQYGENNTPIENVGTYCKTTITADDKIVNKIDKYIVSVSGTNKNHKQVGGIKVVFDFVETVVNATAVVPDTTAPKYRVNDASVSFITAGVGINETEKTYTSTESDLYSVLKEGDKIAAKNGGFTTVKTVARDINPTGGYTYTIEFNDYVKVYQKETVKYIVRFENPLVQEIGLMTPTYLEGYVFAKAKPEGTTMDKKIAWRNEACLDVLNETGLRTALLDKANIDYRYVVDTFESFVETELKSQLSLLCKEKQSAFAICNFPAVKTFIKCNYSSYTDANGVFKVQYVVDGLNKKKAGSVKFSLPTDFNGASFAAFYTPLKFSDGYVDTMVPAAGLVSNLFMAKYTSRKPYYIVAGPNYAKIQYTDLVGPDYTYSKDELNIIEPFGVNCMVYRPGFGTFINANQTAKQTPVSGLSKVNIRELVIYLQDEIEQVLQAYQWEFNNPSTRNAILTKANSICANVAANGGIQAYKNIMDETNNTPEIIDNEMAVLSTHIEPGLGCGKMVQELTLYRTGQMTASIS